MDAARHFGIGCAGHAQCTVGRGVLGCMETDLSFYFYQYSDDLKALCVFHMSACLAFVLQRRDEIAATDICFGLKEGRVRILLSEFNLVAQYVCRRLSWFLFQNQICILFSVLTHFHQKEYINGFEIDIKNKFCLQHIWQKKTPNP